MTEPSTLPAVGAAAAPHPLDPLGEDEIRAAVAAVRATGRIS